MARIDKVVQVVRGNAGTAFAADGIPKGVRVGAGGSVVLAPAGSADGILIVNANRGPYGTAVPVGERVDFLKQGEIVEFGGTAGDRIGWDGTALVAGATPEIGYVMDGGQRLVVDL